MKQTLSFSRFSDAFRDYGRKDNFSYAGLMALYDWLGQCDAETGSETELDVIALCCDFSEYEDLPDFQADYGGDYKSLDDIRDGTIVIPINSESFIVQAF